MTPRRKFLQHSAAIATALQTHQANAIQSKSTIPMALIGCGGQGTNLMLNFAKIPGVEIQYLCDPDPKQSSAAASKLIKTGHKSPKLSATLGKFSTNPKFRPSS